MNDIRRLSNQEATLYCENLSAAIRAARLNQSFPKSRLLCASINAMGPDFHHGFRDDLKVDGYSGLPVYSEWTLLQADQQIAIQSLHKMKSLAELCEKAKTHENEIFTRQWIKRKYYENLKGAQFSPISQTSASLRGKRGATTAFSVVLDKLDVNSLFLRYSIDLVQNANAQALQLSTDEVALQSEALKSLVYRFASLDAKYTFITLGAIAGLRVEKVTKGTIGPVFFPGGKDIPDWLTGFVNTKGMVASFGVEIAATNIVESSSNDPLFPEHPNRISGDVNLDSKFSFFRDRKFAVEKKNVRALRSILEVKGYKSIVYGF